MVSDHAQWEGKRNIYCHSICNATGRVSFTIKLIPSCNIPPNNTLITYLLPPNPPNKTHNQNNPYKWCLTMLARVHLTWLERENDINQY